MENHNTDQNQINDFVREANNYDDNISTNPWKKKSPK
jgi:hypothetical protein